MKRKVKLFHNGKDLILELKEAKGLRKGFGLMLTRRSKAEALLFSFSKPTNLGITSWFVFFPFVAIWLDERGKIISIRRISRFKSNAAPKRKFTHLIEIPINKKYLEVVKFLVED